MNRVRLVIAGIAVVGLAAPASAVAMVLGDPSGDVARPDVDIVGADVAVVKGDLVVRLKLDDTLRTRDVYTVRVYGEGGTAWRLRAVRNGRTLLTADDDRRGRRYKASGQMVNRLVAIRFPAAPLGAENGRFSFSVTATAAGNPRVVDTLPANGRPKGRAVIRFRP